METNEYQDGWDAYLQGTEDYDNPYKMYNYDWHQWNTGWQESYLQHNRSG